MPEALVTIGKYLDVTEAHIAAGRLQSEGIPVYPLDISDLSTIPLPGVGSGSVRLQVPASFEQAARALLTNRESSNEAELTYLATGELSKPEDMDSDRLVFGLFSISDRVKRKQFWIYLVSLDIVFFALVFLAIWAKS